MQINLKRALKLRKALEAHLSAVTLPTTVAVSILIEANQKDAMPAVEVGRLALSAKLGQARRLSRILASLRTKIVEENVRVGIDAILAEAANSDRQVALFKKVVDAGETPEAEVLQSEIALAIKDLNREGDRGYSRPSREVVVGVVSSEMRAAFTKEIVNLKRRKEELEDKRTALNASTMIEISEDDAALLTEAGLI